MIKSTMTKSKDPTLEASISCHFSIMIIIITASIVWTIASITHFQPKQCPPMQSDFLAPRMFHRHSRKAATRIPKESSKEKPNPQNGVPLIITEPYNGPSRVFPEFQHPFPCFPTDEKLMQETPASQGILFQRPHKTGSTTMVGIILRLVHNRAKDLGYQRCLHRTMHGIARQYNYGQRIRSKSFLLSIIRDPKARLISEFFHFDVTARNNEPTDINFHTMILKRGHNYYLRELTTRHYVPNTTVGFEFAFAKSKGFKTIKELYGAKKRLHPVTNRLLDQELISSRIFGLSYQPKTVIQHILDDYDFIAVMERLDESLVVIQMLLGLTTKEIVYTRARSSGTFSNGWSDRPCFYIMKSFISKGMQNYFASEEFQLLIANDWYFYQAVNKSLDITIASLDRQLFEQNLAALRNALPLAAKNCQGQVRTMCDQGGNPIPFTNRTCYIWGEGCDHGCIDELEL
jgi:Sulfotransferase family